MENLFDISQQVVVITGGTGVLGRTISKYLALQGAKVAILGRKAEVGHALVEDIRQEGGVASFHICDVLDKERLQTTCDEILQLYGHIDTLLNGAGGNMPGATIAPDKTIFDLNADDFRKVQELNLTGTLLPTQVFLHPIAQHCQFLVNVGLPTAHTCSRLRNGQGRSEQLHSLHGYGSG